MNILIVEARYFGTVTDALVAGATAVLGKGGARFHRVSVPGVLELPSAIAIAARADEPFDGYVALGGVIGGGIVHDAIYREAIRGLAALGVSGLAIGNGIVMAADEDAALLQAGPGDAGGDAARACLALLLLPERLGHLR